MVIGIVLTNPNQKQDRGVAAPHSAILLANAPKVCKRAFHWRGATCGVPRAVHFSSADDIGWQLPLFTNGNRRPLSLRSPGDASRNLGGKGPDRGIVTVIFPVRHSRAGGKPTGFNFRLVYHHQKNHRCGHPS